MPTGVLPSRTTPTGPVEFDGARGSCVGSGQLTPLIEMNPVRWAGEMSGPTDPWPW